MCARLSVKREGSFMFSVCGNDVDLLVESVCMSVCVMSEGEYYLRFVARML